MTPLKKACSEARPRADFRTRGRLRELFSVDSLVYTDGRLDVRPMYTLCLVVASFLGGRNFRLIHRKRGVIWKDVYLKCQTGNLDGKVSV